MAGQRRFPNSCTGMTVEVEEEVEGGGLRDEGQTEGVTGVTVVL